MLVPIYILLVGWWVGYVTKNPRARQWLPVALVENVRKLAQRLESEKTDINRNYVTYF